MIKKPPTLFFVLLNLTAVTTFGYETLKYSFFYQKNNYQNFKELKSSNKWIFDLNIFEKIFFSLNIEKSNFKNKYEKKLNLNTLFKYNIVAYDPLNDNQLIPKIGFRYSSYVYKNKYKNQKKSDLGYLFYIGAEKKFLNKTLKIDNYFTKFKNFNVEQFEINTDILLNTSRYNKIGAKFGFIYIDNISKTKAKEKYYYYYGLDFISRITTNIFLKNDIIMGKRTYFIEDNGGSTNIDGTVKLGYNIKFFYFLGRNKDHQINIGYKLNIMNNNKKKNSFSIGYEYSF